MSRQNYYLLLELDFHINDYEKIQQKIKQKRAEWSKLRNHPSRGNEFQAKIEALKGIEDVMKDSFLRQREAEDAKQILAKEKAEEERKKFALLDSTIEIISKKGWIEEAEVLAMMKTFNLSKEEVLRRITLPIERRLTHVTQKIQQKVDITKAKEIAECCERLGIESSHISNVPSLYDYLGMAPTSSTDKLLEEAEKRYKVFARKGKSASNNVEVTLQSYCKSIFQNEREKYDKALAQLRLKKLDDYIKIATATNILSPAVKEELIRVAMSLADIDESVATEYIDSYTIENGIKQEGENVKRKFTLFVKKCGFCGLINDQGNQFCTGCQTQLDIKCPSCHYTASSNDVACSKCGFPVGNISTANRLLEKAQLYLSREYMEEAKEFLAEVITLWPNHHEAMKKIKEIESMEKKLNEKLARIQRLVEKSYFYEARSLIIELRNIVKTSSSLQNLEKECLERIHVAESFLRKAQQANDEETAAGYYFKAYEASADCKEAQRMLAKWPPSLPTDLQVIPDSDLISLSWQPSSSKGYITYRLLRKKNSISIDQNDGEVLQESSECSFIDDTAEGGEKYYYSIYAIRGSVFSNRSLTKGPFIRKAEVQDIEIHHENNSIELTWKKPKSAKKIEIWRKGEELPVGRQDGELVGIVTEDRFIDHDVVYSCTYGYRIVVVYDEEQNIFSEGKTIQTKAMRMPKMCENVNVIRKVDGIELFWEHTDDKLDIYYSYTPFQVQTGKPVPLEEFPQFEHKVNRFEKNSVFLSVDMKKTIYILPVTKNEEIAVYGQVKISKEHPEIKNVHHHINKSTLILQWDWPKDVDRVVIVYRDDAFPVEPDDPKATRSYIDKNSYHVLDGYTVSAEERDYYFTIFTIFEKNGKSVYSNGTHYLCVNSEQIDLTYSIKISGLINKKIRLFLTSEVPMNIPDLVLVANKGKIPTKKDSGNVIYRIHSQWIEKAIAFEIPNEYLQKDTYGKLFFVNDQNAAKIRLQSEKGKESMKLW